MPLSGFTLVERLDERSPARAAFSSEGGSHIEVYLSDSQLTIDLEQAALLEILGDSDTQEGEGRLIRRLPLCHPKWPWLFAREAQIRWLGLRDPTSNDTGYLEPADVTLEAPAITDQTFRYVRTEIEITFAPRPYEVFSDALLAPESFTYFDFNGVIQPAVDSREYLRYTDQQIDGAPQVASAQHGQLVFRTGGGGSPDKQTFSGFPYIFLPDAELSVTWYQVPYSLFTDTSHPMWTLIGTVNQTEFLGRPPGSLLYRLPKARRYTPVSPFFSEDLGTTAFTAEKQCDITFSFTYTARRATDPPNLAATNGSWVADGHNTQPFFRDRKYYTVTAPDTLPPVGPLPQDKVPLLMSAPHQLLFSCP